MTALAPYRTETILAIEDVSLTLGGNEILAKVNAQVHKLHRATDSPSSHTGQVIALLAPSGTGKSCLLRIIAGLQTPTSGSVYLGKDHHPTRAGTVGMVNQNYTLFRKNTVLGNLMIAARQAGASRAEARTKARELLAIFGLADKENAYPIQLSGGQRQRVAIARQLLCSDHFLLMDEPTAGLDPIAKKKTCSLISSVANRDDLNTIILCTHDIRSAIAIADTIWLMGRDRDVNGMTCSGARIVEEIDLIARGLMWHADVMQLPEFARTEQEILARFETL